MWTNKLRFGLFFLVLFGTLSMAAQEQAWVHFDKSFYVSGEVAWYSLYLPASWQGQDVAVRTTVLNSNGRQESISFEKTGGATTVAGYFKVPFDANTGYFDCTFAVRPTEATRYETILQKHIAVYSDLDIPANISSSTSSPSSSPEMPLATDVRISVNPSQTHISPRESMQVEIRCTDANGTPLEGTLSVSILEEAQANMDLPGSGSISAGAPLESSARMLTSDLSVTGEVRDMDGKQFAVNVLGAYSGRESKLYYTKSDTKGRFKLDLPDYFGSKPLQFIGFQYEAPDIQVQLDRPQYHQPSFDMVYTEEIMEYLRKSSLRKKLYQQYQTFETVLDLPDISTEMVEWDPDVVYRLQEYETFDDMKGFFGELITPLRFPLQADSTYKAELFNAKGGRRSNTILNGPPLFIIDNKITRDADYVAHMSTSPIESVELYVDAPKLRKYFQAMGASGVVRILTSLSDIRVPEADEANLHRAYGLRPAATFPDVEGDLANADAHRPFFRSQICWQPQVAVDPTGKGSITFTHPDNTGTFRIITVFQTKDGRISTGEATYSVGLE